VVGFFIYARTGVFELSKAALHCILKECEDDCQSQSGSEIALTLGLAIQRSLDSIVITHLLAFEKSKKLALSSTRDTVKTGEALGM
jgi:hypothetical protein